MKTDVAVVGAGPAGLSAAIQLARRGLGVMVVDECHRAGGRLAGQLYENPKKPPGQRLWNGLAITAGLEESAAAAGVCIITGATVWHLSPDLNLAVSGSVNCDIQARTVLLASGSAERALPVPGWTIPGAMSVGAAQVLANVHRVRPGKRVIIAGIDPLSMSVAQELIRAGVEVVGIVLPPLSTLTGELGIPPEVIGRLAGSADLAPGAALRLAGKLFGGKYRRLGARMAYFNEAVNIIKLWGAPLHLRKALVRVEGGDAVHSVVLAGITVDGVAGKEDPPLPVDAVCLSGGLYPVTELAALAGCPFVTVPELGGSLPLHGPLMQTPVPGIYVAGNITGVEGAPVAMAQGELAAAGISGFLGVEDPDGQWSREAALAVKSARMEAPVKFLPTAPAGRERMAYLWERREVNGNG